MKRRVKLFLDNRGVQKKRLHWSRTLYQKMGNGKFYFKNSYEISMKEGKGKTLRSRSIKRSIYVYKETKMIKSTIPSKLS